MFPRKPSSAAEAKRKQTTAIVLLGVIGAEFGQDIEANKRKAGEDPRKRGSVVEGFGIGNNNLARLTSKYGFQICLKIIFFSFCNNTRVG